MAVSCVLSLTLLEHPHSLLTPWYEAYNIFPGKKELGVILELL